MRLQNIIIFIGVMAILADCANSRERKPSSGFADNDTVIHSLPTNYMKELEAMDASSKYEIRSYKDILDLFDKLNYTPEAWQAGIREVPRVYLTIVGDRWGSKTSKEIAVDLKKRIFFRSLAPMILKANELIMMDRGRLEKIMNSVKQNDSITEMDLIWIRKLASLYKVQPGENPLAEPVLDELWKRVDIVPPSLALAQGAEESGWGTSRFAGAGNAIYGQWTWGSDAIVPEKQRKELGNYGIAAFESLQESVSAYMLNLNTHNAYASLRAKRAELRNSKKRITGYVLAGQLNKYSERGEEYVKTLRSLMDYNRLEPADEAYLSDGPPLFLVPATE